MQNNDKLAATPAPERTLPSTERLLRGVQETLQKIATRVGDEQSRAELSSIDTVLSELARRNQPDFYAAFYRDLRALLERGFALTKATLAADSVAAIEADLAALPSDGDTSLAFDVQMTRIHRLMRRLATLVEAGHADRRPALQEFLQGVMAKENEFHLHRTQFAQTRQWPDSAKPPITRERLEAYLREREPNRTGLRVTSFKQLVGGFQKVTILFETEDDGGRKKSLVLRSEKDDKFVALDASDIRREYEIVKFVHDEGVLVAEPFWLEEDEAKLGNRFFVSQRVPGENLGSAVSASGVTDEVLHSYMQGIARLHKIPVSDRMRRLAIGHWLDHTSAAANARAGIRYWRHQPLMKFASPSPLTERLTQWLVDNAPEGDDIPLCLIHCDYGPHNTLVHNGKLSGILDWESARIGDPAEDISWFLQSFGGQVDYGKAIDLYEDATGHRLSEYRLRYYDVLGCLKIMVSHGSAEAMYESHPEASIVWLNLSFRFTPYGTSTAEDRIKLAESVRGR